MNFIWKYVFLIIQDLCCKFTTDRESQKYCFYFENSRSFKWAEAANSDSPVEMMRWKEQDYEQHSDDFS